MSFESIMSKVGGWFETLAVDLKKSLIVHAIVQAFVLFAEDLLPSLASVATNAANAYIAKATPGLAAAAAPAVEAGVQSVEAATDTTLQQLQDVVLNNTPPAGTAESPAP